MKLTFTFLLLLCIVSFIGAAPTGKYIPGNHTSPTVFIPFRFHIFGWDSKEPNSIHFKILNKF